jgi:hypothetical protein
MHKMIARVAAATGVVVMMTALTATAASAAPALHAHQQNNCRVWEEKEARPLQLDRYRVAAECSYVNPAEKVRGVLDLTLARDAHTTWFTDTGVVHHSPWATAPYGRGGVRLEYAAR